MKRFQQQRLFVERQDASPRLVLPALDAAERVADVVALVDRALEDRLEQAALAPHRALRHQTAVLVARIARHLRPPQVQIADDVGLRDLVEPPRAEVRQEVRDDLRVTIPTRCPPVGLSTAENAYGRCSLLTISTHCAGFWASETVRVSTGPALSQISSVPTG